jgi:hypothetical protein
MLQLLAILMDYLKSKDQMSVSSLLVGFVVGVGLFVHDFFVSFVVGVGVLAVGMLVVVGSSSFGMFGCDVVVGFDNDVNVVGFDYDVNVVGCSEDGAGTGTTTDGLDDRLNVGLFLQVIRYIIIINGVFVIPKT